MKLKEGKLTDYAGLTQPKFQGKVFRIFNEHNLEIGFVFFELFKVKGRNEGTFHTFILPTYRTLRTAIDFLKAVFTLGFGELGLEKIYTMADEKMKKALDWHKKMVNENRKLLGYSVFSLSREDYQCRLLSLSAQ